ncbi:hypothetical protein EDC04DRAFT_1657279 [Pisolithus marmoratus]|nr:hypothetical protein EDC04DRAFT_1657279 [Pisolithus marmoratus]
MMHTRKSVVRTARPPTDGVDKLRSELARLKEKETALLQELREIRAAAEQVQVELDSLIQNSAGALIQRLPNEILVTILEHATSYHCSTCVDPCWKWLGVCRRWRNVITHTASLWSHVNITPRWTQMMVKRHLTQSRETPLDITIRPLLMRERWFGMVGPRRHLLSLIVPLAEHARRWRSLDIRGFPPSTLQFMLAQFDSITYSPVESIHIRSDEYDTGALPWPNWISPDTCPGLNYLHLGAFRIPDVVPPFQLTSLALITDNTEWSPSVPTLPFALRGILQESVKLTCLTLYGTGRSFRDLSLALDSIYMPTLHTLNLYPRDIEMPGLEGILMALVAPGLRHLNYVPRWPTDTLTPPMFYGVDGAPSFPRVTDLRIRNAVNGRHDMTSLITALPMVQNVALGGAEITAFLAHSGSHRPVDCWRELESVTVIEPETSIMEDLFRWLTERSCKNKTMLRVSLEELANSSEFLEFHERLMRYAIVELKHPQIKIGRTNFPISPSLRAKLSKYTPGMVNAIGSILREEYTLCEPDDESATSL